MADQVLAQDHDAQAPPTVLSEMLESSVLAVTIEAEAALCQVHLLPHPEPGVTLVLMVQIRPGMSPLLLGHWAWAPEDPGGGLWAEVLRIVEQTYGPIAK
jgi:hypothetical protein